MQQLIHEFPLKIQNRFEIDPEFVAQYIGKQPAWGPLGYVVTKRSYARPIGNGAATEEFWQTIQRVVNGWGTTLRWHCDKYGIEWDEEWAQGIAQEMYQRFWSFRMIAPGRGLWVMGTKHVEKHGSAALNNCCFVSSKTIDKDFADPFTFMMEMLMMGVGVGGDTLGQKSVGIQEPIVNDHTFVVEDSRQGWVDLISEILNAYVGKEYLPNEIDYSEIRKAGMILKTFGGTAAGSGPLIQLVQDIHSILDPLIGKLITSRAIVDLFNAIGRCVVSGNIRRSAEIMLGSPIDSEFLHLKNPELNGDRMMKWGWASNNSVFAFPGMDYTKVARLTALNGEPGYFWIDNARNYGRMVDPPLKVADDVDGSNPCGEIALKDRELCNLIETFPAHHDTYKDYMRSLEIAHIYTKTVSLMPTHRSDTNAVMFDNRRLGISQSGIAQAFARHGESEHYRWCDKGYGLLRDLDQDISRKWQVPESIKLTTVKPSGSVSLLCGATPGMHFPHSEYYWRTVRISKMSRVLQPIVDASYRVEDDVTNPSKTSVVYFPIHERDFSRSKDQVSMYEQMEIAANMQKWWADNQVSVTVTFNENEADEIKNALTQYDTRLKSVSFLPIRDHGYVQAPLIEITQREFEEAVSAVQPIHINGSSNEIEPQYCDGDLCML